MPQKRKSRKPRRAPKAANDPAAKELDAIKRLLVLQLITSGVQSNAIASALGVSKSVVTGLVPARKVKKRAKRS
jgi:hypothetical protein